jgi:hypothetical protein
VDRTQVLWTLVVFFGALVAFGLVRDATEGESIALRLGAQVAALAVIVAAIVVVVRKQR